MNAVVAQRGLVAIPKALRDKLGISTGTVLAFSAESGRLVATKRMDDAAALKRLGKRSLGRRTAEVMSRLRGEPE